MSPIIIQYWMWPFPSIIGCLCHHFLDETYEIDTIIIHCWMYPIIIFWMKLILWYNTHPLLDVICYHFLDETYTVQLSSIVGCNLSSLSGWKFCKETIIPYWMILAITFCLYCMIIIHYWILSCYSVYKSSHMQADINARFSPSTSVISSQASI